MTRHLTLIAALTSALTLAACDARNEENAAGNSTNAGSSTNQATGQAIAEKGLAETTTTQQNADSNDDEALENAATLTLSGTLSAPESTSLPAEAEIHVQLIDVSLEDGGAKVLTEEAFDADQVALPLPFSLTMPSATLNDDHRQVLQAEVRNANDLVLWSTAEPEALALNADSTPGPMALMLEPVKNAPSEQVFSQSDQQAKPAAEKAQAEPEAPEQS
ncbi:MAG: YbaY family lipoprotein [Onishia taeanensis]|uniref:YbaY family lipoprotein n=1 Tax=Halomonadaceae TaxID=28256 RepID=UPI002714E7B1|nr:YbaY family lipoprotein [Halomonas sp. I5-271120]